MPEFRMFSEKVCLEYFERQLEPDRTRIEWESPVLEELPDGYVRKQDDCVRQGTDKLIEQDRIEPWRWGRNIPVLLHIRESDTRTVIERIPYEYKEGISAFGACPGRWASISFSRADFRQYGLALAKALAATHLLPKDVTKIVIVEDKPEYLERLTRAKICCLYSENHAERFGAILPESAVEFVEDGYGNTGSGWLGANPGDIRFNLIAKNQKRIDDGLVAALTYGQWRGIPSYINSVLGFNDHYPAAELYPALMGEELYEEIALPFADGTEWGSTAPIVPVSDAMRMLDLDVDVEIDNPGFNKARSIKVEFSMTPERCAEAFGRIKAKEREVETVMGVWKRFMDEYAFKPDFSGIKNDLGAMREKIARLREIFGMNSALEAALEGVPVEVIAV